MLIDALPDNLRRQVEDQAKAPGDMDKDAFLKILVTQLQNQNPLEPMENTEFIGQMAQFSALEQQVQTNQKLTELSMATSAQISSQAIHLVGKEILIEGSEVALGDSGADLYLDLSASIAAGDVTIRNEDGDVVRQIAMGSHGQGAVTVHWDGRDDNGVQLPPGNYFIEAQGLDADGRSISIRCQMTARVEAVVFEQGIPRLRVDGRIVDLGDIREVRP